MKKLSTSFSLSLSILQILSYRAHFLVTGYTASFHPTLQPSTKGRRPRCHGNSISARTTNFKCYPCAKGSTSEEKSSDEKWRRHGRCLGLDIGRGILDGKRPSRWERNFSRLSRYTSLRIPFDSSGSLFSSPSPCFPFFLSPFPFFDPSPYVQARNFR